jgi:maleate isomerase
MTNARTHQIFSRRQILAGAARAVSLAASVPLLNAVAAPAYASNWRGVVGTIKPNARPNDSSLVDMIRLLPDGIGVVPVYLNITEGTREELQSSYGEYEKNIAWLAKQHCDVISIEGAPPFMLLGPDGEAKLVDGWKQKYRTDMFTSSQNQVNVLRAMKIRKILGITAFGPDLNKTYAKYFEDSGIGVVAMEGIDVAFNSIPDVPVQTIYAFIRKAALTHKGMDAIYILGSGLAALGLVATMEQDLGLPVVQPIAARIWEIERRLHVHQPIKGYGTLLETLPA